MKVYNLTIVFNEDSEEIEYIEETLNRWIPYNRQMKPWKNKLKLTIRDRIRGSLIRWVRSIAFRKLISMERKLARLNIAIQRRNIKKANSGKLDPKSIQKDRQERDQRRLHREQIRRAFVSGWKQGIQHGQNPKEIKQEEVGEILQSKRDRA